MIALLKRHRDAALQNSIGVSFCLDLVGGVADPAKNHFVIRYSAFDIRCTKLLFTFPKAWGKI